MAGSLPLWLYFQISCVLFVHGGHFQTKDQQFIDSLRQYEIVQPKLSEYLTDEYIYEFPVDEERLLSFNFRGRPINIRLTLNRNLLSSNFFERHVTRHGYEIVTETFRNCYFHGSVESDEEMPLAAISTCDGSVEGSFTLENKTYLIQPVQLERGEISHIVFESEQVNWPNYACDLHRKIAAVVSENDVENVTESNHRVRRDVLSETKYVELVVVIDKSQYDHYGANVSTSRAISGANIADAMWRVRNIRVMLIMIEIWKDADQFLVSGKNSELLSNFKAYKRNVLDTNETTKNDHAVLLTQKKLERNLYGVANVLSICTSRSISAVNDKYKTISFLGSIMAHELGHSFGLDDIYDDKKAACPCGDKICLMHSVISYAPLKFSNCSLAQLKETLLRNYGTCLFNLPIEEHYRHAKCGNGFIDEGEHCDCGGKEHCTQMGNHCCDPDTCKLYPHSECSDGTCCKNCTIQPRGSPCREKVNECDLPEFCDGKRPICPLDSYVHNGRSCIVDKEKSQCYLGVCHTYDDQCKTYWGPNVSYSLTCFEKLNIKGEPIGFCKALGNKNFTKCAKKDVKCGKLQCSMSNGSNYIYPLHGTHSSGLLATFGSNRCLSGKLNNELPEIGMVKTGSMCAENKVCYNNTCVDVDEVYQQPECPNNCSGNGICNNLGHCHCNYGYGCPNCSEKCDSEGGSIDSGNDCHCAAPTTGPSTLVVTTSSEQPTSTITQEETTRKVTEPGTSTERGTTTEEIPEGKKEESGESLDVTPIVVPVVFVFILFVVSLLCFIFRQQLLEKCRKIGRSTQPFGTAKSVNYKVGFYSSKENLTDSAELASRHLGLPPGIDPGDKNPGFTSISFMPESKIDSNPSTSTVSNGVPRHFNLGSTQASQPGQSADAKIDYSSVA